MTMYTGKTERLAAVDNMNGCTNFGCMAIDGKKAWGLKTNTDENLSTLYYCPDVNDKATKTYKVANLLGHGNGMTCNGSYLLFACWKEKGEQNNYIIRVPRGFGGEWNQKMKITTPTSVGAISYYSSYHHIVRVPSDVGGKDKFAIGKIIENGNTGKMEYISYFYVDITFAINHGQDIFYDRKKQLLFTPYSIKDSKKQLTINKIQVTNLVSPYTTLNGHSVYAPMDIITVDKSGNSDFEKYEIESLGLDADRKIVMACNIKRKIEGKYKAYDSFQRITNLTY